MSIPHDLRYAARALRRSPGATLVVLATLAVGIGVNTAIFSFVDAILLRPLPYAHADRIVGIWERRPTGQPNAMTTLNYLDYAGQSTVFEAVSATTGCCAWTMLGGETPTPIETLRVSASYFDVLGARPLLGRTFAPGDDRPERDHIVVLSHRLWAARFGSDPSLVGRTIELDRQPYTVVGVMPPDSPFDRTYIQAWVPLPFGPERMNRTSHWLLSLTGGALGLLKPGVTLERARAEMNTIAERISKDYPATNKGWGVVVEPYAEIVVRKELRRSLYLLFAAVGMVLLIGCVNVANVMLARALSREREVAVRLALGASRARLIQQFLVESLLIAITGGLLGVAVGYGTTWFLKEALAALPLNVALLPILIPAEASIGIDARVLVFAALVSAGCAAAFGMAPAMAAIRAGTPLAAAASRRGSASIGHGRVRGALIVAEVALAFVLLVNAALLVRSVVEMQRADTGFDAANVLTAELPVRENRFADAGELHAFIHQVSASVAALPGVSGLAFTDGMPMEGAPTATFVQVASRPIVERAQRPLADFRLVSPSYFRVMGLRLRRGRVLSELDRANTPLVAVINETMARSFFPGEAAVGQRLLMDRPGFGSVYSGGASAFEIVGVIADERIWPFDDVREHPAVYVSNEQDSRTFAGIVVGTSLEPTRMERALRQAIAAVDKDQPVTEVKTLERLKSEAMTPDRLRSALLGAFAAIALALAAIGIYGVISYSVVQRTHEIGIRAALGASPARLVRLVVRQGAALAAAGLAIGYAAALGATRLLESFLFGVASSDPIASLGAVFVLGAVSLAACYLPARHAARVDPLDALRAE